MCFREEALKSKAKAGTVDVAEQVRPRSVGSGALMGGPRNVGWAVIYFSA